MPSDAVADRVSSLFDHWYGTLVRYAVRLTGHVDVAEDMVQEAFYLLYRHLTEGKIVENDRAWTFAVVRRQIARRYPDPARREISFGSVDFLENSVMLVHDRKESLEDLARYFNVLSKREEEVLRLSMDSLKYREIAGVLEISPNSVATLHRRAIAKLRRLLNRPARSLIKKRLESIADVSLTR